MAIGFFRRLSAALPFIVSGKTPRLLKVLREDLLREVETYPSSVNDGYLHVLRAMELARHLKLNPALPIIDVGAATGDMAARFARGFPQATVYCFEPLRSSFEQLTRHVANLERVVPRNVGLAAQSGQRQIQVMNRVTSSSLFSADDAIQDEYLAENIRPVGVEEITLSTLDAECAALDEINLIKLDVQGAELSVLEGGRATLPKANLMLLEMQNHGVYRGAPRYHELDDFLRGSGFTLFNIIPSIRRNLKLYEWDALYVRNSLAHRFDT